MRYQLHCFLIMATASFTAVAAERTPEQIVRAFFGPSGIADKPSCYTGEMLSHFKDQPTLGQSLPRGALVGARPLFASPTRSVFGATIAYQGSTQDWYAFLARESGQWKLEAVRTLAQTGISAGVLQQLRQKSRRTTEEEWMLRNLELMLKSDAELRAFVVSHLKELGQVASLLAAGEEGAARTAARVLHVESIAKRDNGNIELIIGGVVDNVVGFAYVPNGGSPPTLSPDDYIYVEHVQEGWYVFKTT